jgi:hypothetical protein
MIYIYIYISYCIIMSEIYIKNIVRLLSCLLSCLHQTYDKITVDNYYPAYVISYSYPVLYSILTLSYPAHQTVIVYIS